jgi:hypothetical protein
VLVGNHHLHLQDATRHLQSHYELRQTFFCLRRNASKAGVLNSITQYQDVDVELQMLNRAYA